MGGPSGKSKHKKAVHRVLTDKRKRARAKHKEGARCYISKKTGRLKKMKRKDYEVPADHGAGAVVGELLGAKGPAVAPPVTIEADLAPSASSNRSTNAALVPLTRSPRARHLSFSSGTRSAASASALTASASLATRSCSGCLCLTRCQAPQRVSSSAATRSTAFIIVVQRRNRRRAG